MFLPSLWSLRITRTFWILANSAPSMAEGGKGRSMKSGQKGKGQLLLCHALVTFKADLSVSGVEIKLTPNQSVSLVSQSVS